MPIMKNNKNVKRKKKIFRPKKCRFCSNGTKDIDYKDVGRMNKYITEHGKIIGRRITGTCAKHQRQLATSIQRARMMALLPFKGD
jgi:small subunit ribosomal protein S18